MPRPQKCRKVCQLPINSTFLPEHSAFCGHGIILTVDEYEAVRLIDHEGLSQEECSRSMQVARTTAQLIYNSARKKIASALVEGLPLRIEGGNYRLCDGNHPHCRCNGCRKRHHQGD